MNIQVGTLVDIRCSKGFAPLFFTLTRSNKIQWAITGAEYEEQLFSRLQQRVTTDITLNTFPATIQYSEESKKGTLITTAFKVLGFETTKESLWVLTLENVSPQTAYVIEEEYFLLKPGDILKVCVLEDSLHTIFLNDCKMYGVFSEKASLFEDDWV